MNLQDRFKSYPDEQIPTLLQRLGIAFRAAIGEQHAKDQLKALKNAETRREAVQQITEDLAKKIKKSAGAAGGLTVDNLQRYYHYKLDDQWKEMLKQLAVVYGPDGKIDPDQFDDTLSSFVRQRVLKAPRRRAQQALAGVDSQTVRMIENFNDAQLEKWVSNAREKYPIGNAVLIAAEAELARRKLPGASKPPLVDSKTERLIAGLNDAELQSWVKRSRARGEIDDTNPVLMAAEAELAQRQLPTQDRGGSRSASQSNQQGSSNEQNSHGLPLPPEQ